MQKIILILLTSLCLSGCNPLTVLCGDDPDCPRQYFYCPIEKKKVHVKYYNQVENCGDPCMCPEIFTPRNCHWCTTTYTDDQRHSWTSKPSKKVIDGPSLAEARCK